MGEAKKLISNSGIVFIGTLVGSFFSYLFNMLTGRMLGPEFYGEFTALLSVMAILGVVGGAISIITMKYASDLYARNSFTALHKLFSIFTRYVLGLGLGLFLLGLCLSKPIANFLSISQLLPIFITLCCLVISLAIVVNRGVMQGAQQFLPFSLTNALEMFLRLAIGLVLIRFGLKVSGAMAGIVLATGITYLITFFPIKKLWQKKSTQEEKFNFNKQEIIRYSLPVFIASVFLILAQNIDVLMVKHYFPSQEAGIYAAISTIAKIILYGTAPIVGVMFPLISEKKASGDKHYKLFFFSVLLTLLAALLVLGIYYVAPGTIIRILYGARFTARYDLLPEVGFFVLLFALVNLVSNYFLAIKNFIFLYIYGAVILAQIILITMFHSRIDNIVKILIFTTGLLFALLFGYYLITKKDQLVTYFKGEHEPS